MLKLSRLALGAALFVGLAACESSTGLPTEFTQADAIQLAADMDAVATLGQSDVGISPSFSMNVGTGGAAASAAVPVTINNAFTVTKQCPRGGQVALSGTVTGTGDDATHSLTLDANATRIDTDCAFMTRHGVLTLDGNPNITYEGHLNIVNSALVGIQSQTHQGSFTWVRGGGSGTCDVNITSSFNPANNTATVVGTFCGFNINVTHTRS
jgi:hypothetical protein